MLVLAELDYWCHERLDANAWLVFLDDLLEGVYRSQTPTPGDLARCQQLQTTYTDLWASPAGRTPVLCGLG